MAKGDLSQAIDYARRNPQSDFARQLKMRIQSGAADEEAREIGVDLSPFGRPAVAPETQKPEIRDITKGAGDVLKTAGEDFLGAAKSGFQKTQEGYSGLHKGETTLDKALGASKVAAGSVEMALSPLAPVIKPIAEPIGEGFDKITDYLSGTKPFKEAGEDLASTELEDTTGGKTLETAANVGEVASAFVLPPAGRAVTAGISKGAGAAERGIGEAATAVRGTGAQLSEQLSDVVGKTQKAGTQAAESIAEYAERAVSKPIPPQFETALKNTSSQSFDDYANAARKAALDFKNPTPLELAGEKAQSALQIVQDKLSEAGKAKGDFMRIGGAGLTPVKKDILDTAFNRLQSIKNARLLVEGDSKLISTLEAELRRLRASPTVTANSVDKLVDFMQDNLYTSTLDLTIPITEQTTGALRSVIGELNSGLKKQLPARYSNLNDTYSRLVDIRNELNTKLGKEGERGGSLMKRVFSPSDANTKKLFKEVLDETGIDLVNEATIAKYVMEAVGDTRQAAMLEQLALPRMSSTGILEYVKDLVTQRFNTPEAQLERARGMTIQ